MAVTIVPVCGYCGSVPKQARIASTLPVQKTLCPKWLSWFIQLKWAGQINSLLAFSLVRNAKWKNGRRQAGGRFSGRLLPSAKRFHIRAWGWRIAATLGRCGSSEYRSVFTLQRRAESAKNRWCTKEAAAGRPQLSNTHRPAQCAGIGDAVLERRTTIQPATR